MSESNATPAMADDATLDVVADSLKSCPDVRLRVEGHTDSIGAESYNQGLSQRRAESVRDHLVGQGLGARRLEARGYGESRPIADNGTDEGRRLNRRVELTQVD